MFPYGRSHQIDYFCGWRYLLSRSFRKRVRQKWSKSLLTRSACILGGMIGMVFTSALILFALLAAWNLLNAT